MNRPPLVIVIPKRPARAPVQAHAAERHDYTPKPKPNPLALAHFWLGSRLQERDGIYFLDGTYADLTRIMRETNRLIVASGAEPFAPNPRWLP